MTRAVLANKQTMEVGEQIWQVTEKELYEEEEDQGVIGGGGGWQRCGDLES